MAICKRVLVILVIIALFGCASDRALWREAVKANTIEAFGKYLEKKKKGEFKKQAEQKRRELIEQRDYELAVTADKLDDYRSFLEKYPQSKHSEEIKGRIYRIREEKEFIKAKKKDTITGYEEYLEAYPESKYKTQVDQELRRLRKILLDTDWEQAQKINTCQGYEDFIRKYPITEYTAPASRKIEQLGSSKELTRVRGLIMQSRKESTDAHKKPAINVLAIMETTDKVHFIYKDEKGIYHKVTADGVTEFRRGIDVPLLRYAKPREGVLLYISFDDILKKYTGSIIVKPMDKLFAAFGISDKSNLIFRPPRGVFYTREYTKKERENGIAVKHALLLGLTSVEKLLSDLHGRDPAKRYDAVRALGVFGDKRAIGPLKKELSNENEKIRYEAKKSLSEIEDVEYTRAKKNNTVAAYETFLKQFPGGSYAKKVAISLRDIKKQIAEENAWAKAKQADSYRGYKEYLGSYRHGKYVKEARAAIVKVNLLSDIQISLIHSNKQPGSLGEKSELLDRLLYTGASCLDSNAYWINRDRGRKVYNILKRYDSGSLSAAMKRVILMDIDRLHVLFIVVKLGISGTQEPLVDLLHEYGSKSMAEDYLNSGSSILIDGGRDWARRRGYNILSGPGSHRVNWGRF